MRLSGITVKNLSGQENVLYIVAIATTALFNVMHCVFLYTAWSGAESLSNVITVDTNMVLGVMTGLLLVVLGNFMPKTKRNSAVPRACTAS